MKLILKIILVLVGLFIAFYYFFLIQEYKIEDNSLLTICRENGKIEIGLADSFHYLSSVDTITKGDTIVIEAYFTTIGNFFNSTHLTEVYFQNSNVKFYELNEEISPILQCKIPLEIRL
jgi:hypothetical protein